MPVVAITPGLTDKFSVKGDTGPDRTVFNLGSLDSVIQAHITDETVVIIQGSDDTESHAAVRGNAVAIKTCRFCIRGWSNFKDADGNDIPFETEKVTVEGQEYDAVPPRLLRLIPLPVMREISDRIDEINGVSDDEGKDSGADC